MGSNVDSIDPGEVKTMRYARNTRLLVAIGLAVAIAAVHAQRAGAQDGGDPNSAPNPYVMEEGWAELSEGRAWGATRGESRPASSHAETLFAGRPTATAPRHGVRARAGGVAR